MTKHIQVAKSLDVNTSGRPCPDGTQFKVGSLVRIARQPKEQWVKIVGERGYIEEIEGNSASFRGIYLGEHCAGMGWVPLDCLEFDNGEDLKAAYLDHKMTMDTLLEEHKIRQGLWEQHVANCAKKYKVSKKQVLDIWAFLNKF